MRLISDAFAAGQSIPLRYTCEGEDLSPALRWSDAPGGTKSFVLLCDDPDAPAGTWHHWAVYDIPPDMRELAEGASRQSGLKQAVNDFCRSGYGGPCPPRGHGVHHYHFRLLALSVERLHFGKPPTCVDVDREAHKHAIDEAILIGTYQR
jgi:Raf kinase inhibitor-like YbhB/YbcL family protein